MDKETLTIIMILVTVMFITNTICLEIQYQSYLERQQMIEEMWDNLVFPEPINITVNRTKEFTERINQLESDGWTVTASSDVHCNEWMCVKDFLFAFKEVN